MQLKSIMKDRMKVKPTAKPLKLDVHNGDITTILKKYSSYVYKNLSGINISEIEKGLRLVDCVSRGVEDDEINIEYKGLLSELPILSIKDPKVYEIKEAQILEELKLNKAKKEDVLVFTTSLSGEKEMFVFIDKSNKIPLTVGGSYNFKASAVSYWGLKFKTFRTLNLARLYPIAQLYDYLVTKVDSYNKTADTPVDMVELKTYFSYFIWYNPIYSKKYRVPIRLSNFIRKELSYLIGLDKNIELTKKYILSETKSYAKVYETKKGITDKTLDRMKKSSFLQTGFRYLEIDNDTDLHKFTIIEEEWKKIYPRLPKTSKVPELRFRKLGQHNAIGIYFAQFDCICIDIRNVNAFIHEYAHHLDFTTNPNLPLSLHENFSDIIYSYSQEFSKLPKDSKVYLKSDYYLTPTEIFARASEMYLGVIKRSEYHTPFFHPEEVYRTNEQYTCFKNCMKEIEAYMKNIYG